MIKMLLSVPVIMACAVGGTVGLLKLIEKLTPGKGVPKDPVSKTLEEARKRQRD